MQYLSTTLDLGGCRINWLDCGSNNIDGGAMFGAVPKILWSKRCPADEENYITQVCSPLLIQTRNKKIIVDTGFGNKLSEKQQKIFRVQHPWRILSALANFGLDRFAIDFVILTHGDFDHAGGSVFLNSSKELEITFPNAQYIIQKTEWEDICNPIERTKHTYFAENFIGLLENNQLVIIDGDKDFLPEIRLHHSGGHTRGHQVVEIVGEENKAIHLGDLLPMHYHINPLWITAYDNFPLDAIERKKEFYRKYRGKECWFTFYHDTTIRAMQLNENNEISKIL